MRTLVEQWAPRKGYVRRQLPQSSDSWSSTNSIVAQYIAHLEILGLDDPTDATQLYDQAVKFRQAYADFAIKQNREPDLSERLVQGDITIEDAAKQIAKGFGMQDASEKAERQRQVISNAIRGSYSSAVRAIHNFGESKWLELLRPFVMEAYEDKDQERWDALHRFARLLRDPDIAGLAMIGLTPTGAREFEELWRFTVGRPDLYWRWRRDHCEMADNVALIHVGSTTYVATVITKGPHPTLADIEPSWEPGLYSAVEVMEITDRILDQQQAAQIDAEVEAVEGRPAS